MRIISGKYGGRNLNVPHNNVIRPTSDKVRGAIMNSLQSHGALEGAVVMDGFCGTGALGIEALSRGASTCLFIDQNDRSLELAQENVKLVGAGDVSKFILKDMTRLQARTDDFTPKTLVFLDPPYGQDLVYDALESLAKGDWLSDDAVIVVEEEKDFVPEFDESFEVFSEKEYGDTKVFLLRQSAAVEKE